MRQKPTVLLSRQVLPVLILAGLMVALVLGSRMASTGGKTEDSRATAQPVASEAPLPALAEPAAVAQGDTAGSATAENGHEAAAGPQPEDDLALPAIPAPVDRPASALKRVGLQAGHWRSAELPDELARLRTSTGTAGGGVAEWQLNLDIAHRVALLLEEEGIVVDILPATVPPAYQADAFVALHADGDATGRLSGFKLARARASAIPTIDDALLAAIQAEYRAATKLAIDPNVSRNMTGYYGFNYRRFQHAIAPGTPAVILEMGFLTNAADRKTLLGTRAVVAEGIVRGILRFLETDA